MMSKGATLINTARKVIINDEELYAVLKEREDLKYATDIASDDIEFLKAEFGTRAFATPKKMGVQTFEANVNAELVGARQIVEYFERWIIKFKLI